MKSPSANYLPLTQLKCASPFHLPGGEMGKRRVPWPMRAHSPYEEPLSLPSPRRGEGKEGRGREGLL